MSHRPALDMDTLVADSLARCTESLARKGRLGRYGCPWGKAPAGSPVSEAGGCGYQPEGLERGRRQRCPSKAKPRSVSLSPRDRGTPALGGHEPPCAS